MDVTDDADVVRARKMRQMNIGERMSERGRLGALRREEGRKKAASSEDDDEDGFFKASVTSANDTTIDPEDQIAIAKASEPGGTGAAPKPKAAPKPRKPKAPAGANGETSTSAPAAAAKPARPPPTAEEIAAALAPGGLGLTKKGACALVCAR